MSAMSQPGAPRWSRQDDRVTWRGVGEEIVILDTRDSLYHSLNPSGARLWERLAEPTSHCDLVDVVVNGFDVDRAVAERDVRDFLAAMCELGLVESSG